MGRFRAYWSAEYHSKTADEFAASEKSEFGAEMALPEAIRRSPELIPIVDLDLGLVVVGRETPLPTGAIDLLLVDAEGQGDQRKGH